MLMNASYIHTTVTQMLFVTIHLDHSCAFVKLATMEMVFYAEVSFSLSQFSATLVCLRNMATSIVICTFISDLRIDLYQLNAI